jgi:hypothetical protein
VADGYTRGCHHVTEQPVRAECGGHDCGVERQHINAHPSDNVRTGLCRSEEHLHVRRGCIGIQQRVASTGHLDCAGCFWHTVRGFCDAERGVAREPDFHAAILGHGRSGELAICVRVFQPHVKQCGQFLFCVLQRRGQPDRATARQWDGVADGYTGGCHHVTEQPVLTKCSGYDGRVERQHIDAHPSDDVLPRLRRSQEHLHVRRGCIGIQQRVAAARNLDRTGRFRHTVSGFCDAERGVAREPDFHAAILGHGGSGELAMGMGIFQPHVKQCGQFLFSVLQRIGQPDRATTRQWDGVAHGYTRGCHYITEQPVLAERSGHDGRVERQHADAHPSGNVLPGLCRSEEHLHVRHGCIGGQ